MKAFWQTACSAIAVLSLGMLVQGCNDTHSSQGSASCSYINGTWVGHEVDLDGSDRGPVTATIRDAQVQFDIGQRQPD